MTLPAEILNAVSAPGGGKITLVVGAGCSFEAPTSIPLASTCSAQCHGQLVANGSIVEGACQKPADLSSLADAVFSATGSQALLVEQLRARFGFKTATPNEGHSLAAALLGESAIAAIVTLNFDLALTTAIGNLGVGDAIGIIDGPADFGRQKVINLYYLHGNASATDPDAWVLRTAALKLEWQGQWQSVVAAKALSAPVVIFVGLGSPADVLVQSAKLIKAAIPDGHKVFQVDPAQLGACEFFQALELDSTAYIQDGWCEFMQTLSARLAQEHTVRLRDAALALAAQEHLAPEDCSTLLDYLRSGGLLQLGRLRSSWLLHGKPYCPDEALGRAHLADILLAVALIERTAGVTSIACEDGVVEFRRGDRIVAAVLFASGRGAKGQAVVMAELSGRKGSLRRRAVPPTSAIVTGLRDAGAAAPIAPDDILLGPPTEGSIVFGSSLRCIHADELRRDSTLVREVAP